MASDVAAKSNENCESQSQQGSWPREGEGRADPKEQSIKKRSFSCSQAMGTMLGKLKQWRPRATYNKLILKDFQVSPMLELAKFFSFFFFYKYIQMIIRKYAINEQTGNLH